MKRKLKPAFPYFWTTSEWASDRRTGAVVRIEETMSGGWSWVVGRRDPPLRREGRSTTQKGARAAARRFVRTLPDKPKKAGTV